MKRRNESDCQQAQPFYFDYLTHQMQGIPAIRVRHIEECPQCRDEIKRLEDEISKEDAQISDKTHILALHHQYLSEWIDCEIVKPFLPSLVHPELTIRTETPVTVHLDRCPDCRHDLQTIISLSLNGQQIEKATRLLSNEPAEIECLNGQTTEIIQAIRNRKPSGVITRMEVDVKGESHIRTRISAPCKSDSLKPVRLFARTAAVAAAVLLVSFLLLFKTTNTVQGTTIHNVYEAINSVRNCRIEVNTPDQDSASQIILISRELNLAVFQQGNDAVLLDIQNRKILRPDRKESLPIAKSAQEMLSEITQPGFGLLPFEIINRSSPDYQWIRQDNLSLNTSQEVYDLKWKKISKNGIVIEKTWRGYLFRDSHLPAKIQWFEKLPGEMEKSVLEMTLQYINTQTVLEQLKESGLYHLLKRRGDQIE